MPEWRRPVVEAECDCGRVVRGASGLAAHRRVCAGRWLTLRERVERAERPSGWVEERCFGCNGAGVELGMHGDLAECSSCRGAGGWWRHVASGALAAWPGGPFVGRTTVRT